MKVLVGLPLKTKEIVKVVKVLLNLKEIIFKVVSSRGVGKTFTTFTTFTFENCPFSFPGNTALTQQFQFPVLSGLEPFSGRAVDAGLVKTEGLSGKLMGQREPALVRSDLPSTAKRMGFPRREAPSPNR